VDTRERILTILMNTAPELSADEVTGTAHLQDDLDLDSMDVLNYFADLSDAFGVDIPERDYPQLATLDGAVAYLERAASPAGG
jgi:acyl carrier protein